MANKTIKIACCNNKARKGQVSLEHLIMVAIAMLTLLPVIYLFYNYSKESTSEVNFASVNNLGNKIINRAESVYYLGEPSKLTLEENMPLAVQNIAILQDSINNIYELVFTLDGNETAVFSSDVPISGDFTDTSVSQGTKTITIESLGSYVNITIT